MTNYQAPKSKIVDAGSTIDLRWLLCFLFGWILTDNLLLLSFLGFSTPATFALILFALSGLFVITKRLSTNALHIEISLRCIALCCLIALGLLLLGGEGRLLFANSDWEIRDALLRDMGMSPWPYAYQIADQVEILRAPIGMYLKPALFGGASQAWRDIALLLCNTVFLGLLFALGSVLFKDTPSRCIGLAVFIFFSGLDILGTLLVSHSGGNPSYDHIEAWLAGVQYSSHITLLFWVPQHALAGWLCAILYLLWERGYVRFSFFLAAVPLLAIWSPLAIMGAVPFALYAGLKSVWHRDVILADILLGALVLAVAIPSLIYLRAGLGDVSSRWQAVPAINFAVLILFEIAPFAIFIIGNSRAIGSNRATFGITILLLLLMPHYRIGPGPDFQMRAAIMPIAILAFSMGKLLSGQASEKKREPYLLGILILIGSTTGLLELARAIRLQPSPPPNCSLIHAYFQQSGLVAPTSSYFAPVNGLSSRLRPDKPVIIPPDASRPCWTRNWKTPRGA
jgi:hypothetical protein